MVDGRKMRTEPVLAYFGNRTREEAMGMQTYALDRYGLEMCILNASSGMRDVEVLQEDKNGRMLATAKFYEEHARIKRAQQDSLWTVQIGEFPHRKTFAHRLLKTAVQEAIDYLSKPR